MEHFDSSEKIFVQKGTNYLIALHLKEWPASKPSNKFM